MNKEKTRGTGERLIAVITIVAVVILVMVSIFLTLRTENEKNPANIGSAGVSGEEAVALGDGKVPLSSGPDNVTFNVTTSTASVTINSQTVSGSSEISIPPGATVSIQLAEEGFLIKSVTATSTDGSTYNVSGDGTTYTISAEQAATLASLSVTTEAVSTSPGTTPPPSGGLAAPLSSPKTLGLEITSVSITGTSNDKVLAGATATYNGSVSVKGVDGVILLVPMDVPGLQISNNSASPSQGPIYISGYADVGVPDGYYFALEVVNPLTPEGIRAGSAYYPAFDYKFTNGTTPPGTTQQIAIYALEAEEVSSNPTVTGGSLAIKKDCLVKYHVPEGKVLTSEVNEDFSIAKTLKTASETTAGVLALRNYGDINNANKDLYTIEYEIALTSTGSGATGRLFTDGFTITDTLEGFGSGTGQAPSKIKVDGVEVPLTSLSGNSFSFDIPVAGSATSAFENKTYKVEVTFSRNAYTNMYGQKPILSSPAAIKNTVTAEGHVGTDTITVTPTTNSVTSYIGYKQGDPASASIKINKYLSIGDIHDVLYDSTWQGRMGVTPTFTLSPAPTSGNATVPVGSNGTLTFNLEPDTTYTLTEDIPLGFKSSIGTGVQVVVSKIQSDGSVKVTVNGTDLPAGGYNVTNTSDTNGNITLNVLEQKVGIMDPDNKKHYEPVAAGITVYLYESDGVTPVKDSLGNPRSAETDAAGQVQFWNVKNGEYVFIGQDRTSDKLALNPSTGLKYNFALSGSAAELKLLYDSTLGGFYFGKKFESADGSPIDIGNNYSVTFEVYKGVTLLETHTITNTNNPGYVTEYFEAGTYIVKEKTLTIDGKDQTGNFSMYDGTVNIVAGEFMTLPSGADTDKKVKNVSNYGQIKIEKKSYDGSVGLGGFSFNIKGPGGYEKIVNVDPNGMVTEWVPAGEYTITEVQKDGYIQTDPANGASRTVVVTASTPANASQTATFRNAILPTMTAKKVRADDQTVGLNGATFQLYALNAGGTAYEPYGAQVTSAGTGTATGSIKITDINIGKYILVETDVPSGFMPPTYLAGLKAASPTLNSIPTAAANTAITAGMKTFTVTQSDYGIKEAKDFSQGNITNVPASSVYVTKASTKSTSGIAGATFDLYKVGDTTNYPKTIISSTGATPFTGLDAGDYYIVETGLSTTGAAANYVLRENDKFSFSVDANGAVSTGTFDKQYEGSKSTVNSSDKSRLDVTFTNAPKAKVDMTKIGETNIITDALGNRMTRPLPNVEFQVIVTAGPNAGKYLTFSAVSDGNYAATGIADAPGASTTIKTGAGGALSINGLDPNVAMGYTLREVSVPGDGVDYAPLPDQTITLTEASSSGKITEYTAALTGSNTDSKNTVTNTVEIHYARITKWNLYKTNHEEIVYKNGEVPDPDFDSDRAFGGEFELYIYNESTSKWDLLETLVTGTMDPDELNTAISGQLTTGRYKLVEIKAPAYAKTPSADNPAYAKDSNGDWEPILTNPTKPEWEFLIPGGSPEIIDVELGNTGATGPGEAPVYVRLKGEKLGYALSSDGTPELQGALIGVSFSVTKAYIDANGEYHAIGTPVFIETTGIVESGGTRSYGSFLTALLDYDSFKVEGQSNYGFIVEELGPLPSDYDPGQVGQKFYVAITVDPDHSKIPKVNGEMVVTVEITMDNFVGTGTLNVNKYEFGSTSTTSGLAGATFDVYRVSTPTARPNELDKVTGVTLTTAGAAGSATTKLPAGYYWLKETAAPGSYATAGNFTVDRKAGTAGNFGTAGFIGPIVISGDLATNVKVYDREKPTLSIQALWNGIIKPDLNATYTVRREGTVVSIVNGVATSGTQSLITVPNLEDGVYTITENSISTTASEFTANSAAGSPGIIVVVKDGLIESATVDGVALGTTKAPTDEAIWTSGTNSSSTIHVNHMGEAVLIIDMGWIDLTGTAKNENGGIKGAGFRIEPVTSSAAEVGRDVSWVATEGSTTNELRIDDLKPGIYAITQKTVNPADGYVIDGNTVYVELLKGHITYLQNNDANYGVVTPDNTHPIVAVPEAEAVKKWFYNKVNQAELKIVKYDAADPDVLLNGAEFAFCKNISGDALDADDPLLLVNIIPSTADGPGVYTTSAMVAPGTYYIKETRAPNGYSAGADVFEAIITENGYAVIGATKDDDVNVARVSNSKLGSFIVHKVTMYPEIKVNETVLAGTGVEFSVNGLPLALYKMDDAGDYQPVTSLVTWPSTVDNGRLEFLNLEEGFYKVLETLPSNGTLNYLGLSDEYTDIDKTPVIEIGKDLNGNLVAMSDSSNFSTNTATLKISNPFDGVLPAAKKVDYDTRLPIAGASFELYSVEGTVETSIITRQTGADGTVVFTPIYRDAGKKYFIREISAGTGYMMNDFYDAIEKEVVFPAEGGNRYVVVEFKNKKDDSAAVALGVDKTVSIQTVGGAMSTPGNSVIAERPLREGALTTEYTIIPSAPNNILPIENYTISDAALVFDPVTTPQPVYTINSVTVGASTAVASAGASEAPVYARVDSIDAGGVTTGTSWKLLNGDQSFVLTAGAVGFHVVYSQTDSGSEPAVVGVGFKPGAISVNVFINRFVPTSVNLQPEIKSITNTVTVSAEGLSPATDTAKIETPVESRPTMSVTKVMTAGASAPSSYKPTDTVSFTITMTNDSDDNTLVIEKPVLIDYMPKGSMIAPLDSSGKPVYEVLEGHVATNVEIKNGGVVYWHFGNTTLKKGESITITYQAQLASVVAAATITNYALGTSDAGLKYSETYPTGASFEPGRNGTDVTSGAIFDELGAERGRYIQSDGVNLAISLSDMVLTLRSIGVDSGGTIEWNSSTIPTEVYLGGKFYYRSQTQNGVMADGATVSNIVINEALPKASDPLITGWPQDLLDLITIDYSKVVVKVGDTTLPSSSFTASPIGTGSTAGSGGGINIVLTSGVTLQKNGVISVEYPLQMPTPEKVAEVMNVQDLYDNHARTRAGSSHQVGYDITLAPDSQTLSSNTVYAMLMAAPVSITGTVWNDDDNDGIMNEINPVVYSGVEVLLYKMSSGSTDWTLYKETFTNADGEYSFTGIESSSGVGGPEYMVVFVNDDPMQLTFGDGFDFDPADAGNDSYSHVVNTEIDVLSGNVLGNTGSIELTVPGVINAGLVSVDYTVTYLAGVAPEHASQVTGMPNPSVVTVKAGSMHTVQPAPARSGYIFNGWADLGASITNPGRTYDAAGDFKMPPSNVELTAQWVPDTRNIEVNSYKEYYDAAAHNVTVTGSSVTSRDEIKYFVKNGMDLMETTIPGYVDATTTAIHVWVEVWRDGALIWGDHADGAIETLQNHGTVEILRIPLLITSESRKKAYDGNALTAGGAIGYDGSKTNGTRLTSSSPLIPGMNPGSTKSFVYRASGQGAAQALVGGETIFLKTTASITNVGDTNNTIELEWGTASQTNYDVVLSEGVLVITEYEGEIVVIVSRETFTYDGTLREAYVASYTGLPAGYTVRNTGADAFATNVTNGKLVAKCIVFELYNSSGTKVDTNPLTTRLNIKYIDGYLEILPAPLVIVTDSAEKDYDGNPLTAPGRITGFVPGEEVGFAAIGRQVEIGSSSNQYDLLWNNPLAQDSNYVIVKETIGILTVFGDGGGVPDKPVIPGVPSGDPNDPVVIAVTQLADTLQGIIEALVPLTAGREGIWCWVHWYIMFGLLLTSAGGIFVIARRQRFSTKLGDYEERLLQDDDDDDIDRAV